MAKIVLVIPGTGKQGRAVTNELLRQGLTVRIFVRNPSSDAAKEALSAGALVCVGDLGSTDTLVAAFDKVFAVFFAIPADRDNEITYASNVLNAVREKDVQHLVYSSVARTGDHESFPDWNDNYPLAWYWKNKHEVEEMVRAAGSPSWTIIRPAFFYENFYRPEVDWMFPGLADRHELHVAFNPDTKLDLIHVSDIALVTVAAMNSPSEFSGKELTLGSESLTAAQIAEKLSIASGETVTVRYLSEKDIRDQEQQGNMVIASQVWMRDVGYGVGTDTVSQLGLRSMPMLETCKEARLNW